MLPRMSRMFGFDAMMYVLDSEEAFSLPSRAWLAALYQIVNVDIADMPTPKGYQLLQLRLRRHQSRHVAADVASLTRLLCESNLHAVCNAAIHRCIPS